MQVMVGSTRSRKLVARIRELGWGRVFCERPTPYPGEPWVLDNGAFAAWKSGKPFSAERFAKRAAEWAPLRPAFAVLPDVVGGGVASLEMSMSWLPRLPADIRWYLAVQDGMTPATVGPALDVVDGIFLGGTDAFKATAWEWAALARARGKSFHYARVSTPLYYRRALDCGADSCDSTQPLWSRDEWRKFERVVFDLDRQRQLFGGRARPGKGESS
jgi:hypothetical protein